MLIIWPQLEARNPFAYPQRCLAEPETQVARFLSPRTTWCAPFIEAFSRNGRGVAYDNKAALMLFGSARV